MLSWPKGKKCDSPIVPTNANMGTFWMHQSISQRQMKHFFKFKNVKIKYEKSFLQFHSSNYINLMLIQVTKPTTMNVALHKSFVLFFWYLMHHIHKQLSVNQITMSRPSFYVLNDFSYNCSLSLYFLLLLLLYVSKKQWSQLSTSQHFLYMPAVFNILFRQRVLCFWSWRKMLQICKCQLLWT